MKYSINILTKSAIATRNKLSEQFSPSKDIIDNGKMLFDNILSKIPIEFYIESFYRCPRLNKLVGGSSTSDHMKGYSADLDSVGDKNNKAIFDWIRKNCDFDQLIWEYGTDKSPSWIHVSRRKSGNRRQVLRTSTKNGKTVYTLM